MSEIRRILTLVGLFLCLTCAACGGFQHDSIFEVGKVRRIQLYSGKEKVGEWETRGNIELNGDKYYFKDDRTGRTISVSGTVVIETE